MSVPTREVACPNCNAQPWEACTRATNTGRAVMVTFHHAREDLAQETPSPKPPPSRREIVAEALLVPLQNDKAVQFIACDCGSDLEITEDTTVLEVATLLDHAAHAHVGRRDINVYRSHVLLSGNELGLTLKLDPLTEAEQTWRDSRA